MKKILFFLIFSFIILLTAVGQIIKPATNNLLNNSVLFAEEPDARDLLIRQINDAGNLLLATEQEMAFSNKAFINQTGNNHKMHLTQIGYGNEASLLSEGGFTIMNVTQTGNNNSIFSNLSNNTLQLYSAILEQKGNSNNIEFILSGNNVIPDIERIVSVKQTGNDLNFSGEYDSPNVPVQIEQKSGNDGAGMSVSVATSAFYFPMKK